MFAVREQENALDIVQDSMLKLAEKYGDRPADEFPMLFQRILQNDVLGKFKGQQALTGQTMPSTRSRNLIRHWISSEKPVLLRFTPTSGSCRR